ncbi:MAG: cytochrome d ubiquinol oxidase subunit II, partial [Candidatus Zixiibacteriota bacterium]
EFVVGWINPLSVFSAFFTVGICAHLSAVFLTREAYHHREAGLERAWRRRALFTGAWVGILLLVGIVLIAIDAEILWLGFQNRSWPAIGVVVVAGAVSAWTLRTRCYTLAAICSSAAVSAVIWGWGLGQYPHLIPPNVTVMTSKAPDQTLWFVIQAAVLGSLLLIPSLVYLLYLFKFRRT